MYTYHPQSALTNLKFSSISQAQTFSYLCSRVAEPYRKLKGGWDQANSPEEPAWKDFSSHPTCVIAREQAVTTGARYSLELLHEGAMVSYVLPKAFKNGANVIANGELVVEFTGGSGVLNI